MSKKCFHCIRVAVVVVNFILLLIGVALLGSAVFLYIRTTDYDLNRSPDHYSEFRKIHSIIMGIGIFTILLSTLGCCGAYHESHLLLTIYFCVILLLFGNQIAAGSMYVVYKDEKLTTNLKVIIANFKEKKITTSEEIFLDTVQKMLKCCGNDGTSDYEKKGENLRLPVSCCNYQKFSCKKDMKLLAENAFTEGCSDNYSKFSQQKLRVISMIMIVMSVTEFLGMIFSIAMCFAIRYSYNNHNTNSAAGYAPVTRNMII